MQDDNLRPYHSDRQTSGVAQQLRDFGFTAAICVVIAAVIWGLGGAAFLEALAFSIPIGLSTHLFTRIGMLRFPHTHIGLIWAITVPAGVIAGIAAGGLILGIPLADLAKQGTPFGSFIIALAATYVFYSYYTMNEMRERLRAQEVSRLRSDKRLVETRMRLLQSQIEPHFLFNTLSNVLSLVRTDPSRAEDMLQQLTRFLRASLQRSREDRSSVQDELDLVDSYLAILKIRMGERLEYEISTFDGAADVPLSPLVLQPIVENAVIHGLEPLERGGRIDVKAELDGDSVLLTVEDTGAGLGDASASSGFGLSNVRERLGMLYGEDARLEFSQVEPSGLRVRAWIPKRVQS